MSVAIRIIPCLDVKDGRVVKGVNFTGLRDAGDPVELARRYDAQGADEITFLDVSASAEGRATMVDVVSAAADQVFVPLTVGGGVRTVQDVARLLAAGADKVGVNTAAVARPELLGEVADRFGNQVIVLSVDARRSPTIFPLARQSGLFRHHFPPHYFIFMDLLYYPPQCAQIRLAFNQLVCNRPARHVLVVE